MNRVVYFILVLFFPPLTWSVETIKIGMMTALTRSAAGLGFNVHRTADIYIDENEHQAIHHVGMTHFKAGEVALFRWPMLQKKTI